MQKAHSIKIKNFRVISELEYHPTQINLIVGPNNSGKTAIIDAISTYYLKDLPYSWGRDEPFKEQPGYNIRVTSDYASITIDDSDVFLFKALKDIETSYSTEYYKIRDEILSTLTSKYLERGYPEENSNAYLENIFGNFDFFVIWWKEGYQIFPYYSNLTDSRSNFRKFLQEFSLENNNDKRSRFIRSEFELTPSTISNNKGEPEFPVIKIRHSSKHALGEMSEEDIYFLEKFIQENDLIDGLERLSREEVIYRSDTGILSLPLLAHGDGFIAMLVTMNRLLKAKDGLLLIEEPENHLHPRYIQVFADVMIRCSKKLNVQVFMTTHSHDLIQQFLTSADSEESKNIISILRVTRDGENILPMIYDVERASHVIEDLLLDIRGG